MKCMFTWILVLTVLLCLPLFAAAAEAPASDFKWETNDDGSVTITKYTGNDEKTVIPKQINGKPVTQIGHSAFDWCSGLNQRYPSRQRDFYRPSSVMVNASLR